MEYIMKVAELIKMLKEMPQDVNVKIIDNEGYDGTLHSVDRVKFDKDGLNVDCFGIVTPDPRVIIFVNT